MRGDQGGGRQGSKGRPMSGATDRGRSVLAGLMAEGLGDQVLLLRIFQVSTLHFSYTLRFGALILTVLHPFSSCSQCLSQSCCSALRLRIGRALRVFLMLWSKGRVVPADMPWDPIQNKWYKGPLVTMSAQCPACVRLGFRA